MAGRSTPTAVKRARKRWWSTPTSFSIWVAVFLVVAVFAVTANWWNDTVRAQIVDSGSSSSYDLAVNVDVALVGDATIGPLVASSGSGPPDYTDPDTLASASLTVGAILAGSTGLLETDATGTFTADAGTTAALATVNDLELDVLGLLGVNLLSLGAETIGSTAQVTGTCGQPLTASGTTTLEDAALSVTAGVVDVSADLEASPAPNTAPALLQIPGVLSVILNEQIVTGDGTESRAIEVNAIHITLNVLNLVTADIIIGHSEASLTCDLGADLSIEKTADAGEYTPGQPLTYTLAVSNAGPNSAEAPITVTDTLPAGVTFQSASGTEWDCDETAGVVTCTRDTALPPGAAPDITVVVIPTDATPLEAVNTASLTSTTHDPDEENNDDEVTTSRTAPPPFECPTNGFLFQYPGNVQPTLVQSVDIVSGGFETALTLAGRRINAVGYNVVDNYIYGWDHASSQIVRVGSDGAVDDLGVPTGVPAVGWLIGDVDANGDYWLYSIGSGDWYRIDLASFTLEDSGTAATPAGYGSGGADWAFVPGTNALYRVAQVSATQAGLLRFDRTSQSWSVIDPNIGHIGGASASGAVFADPDGFLYASENNSGEIWRIQTADVPTDVESVFFAQGPNSSNNDGARCANAPIPIDFGDAPEEYGTTLVDDGARHAVPGYDPNTHTAPVMLGSANTIDIETDGVPSLGADGDDLTDVDDEGGVASFDPLAVGDTTYSVTVSCTGEGAIVAGWVDFNRFDGFANDTQAQDTCTGGEATLTWTGLEFVIFAGGTTYARFRIATNGDELIEPTGAASNGEVEDYTLFISDATPQLTLDKFANPEALSGTEEGEVITYTFRVTNTGDVTLAPVTVTDPMFPDLGQIDCDPGAGVSDQIASLAPGDFADCFATHTVPDGTPPNTPIDNTATANGCVVNTDICQTAQGSETVPGEPPRPALELGKFPDAEAQTGIALGVPVTYNLSVHNAGNVTLTDVTVTDSMFEDDEIDCGTGGTPSNVVGALEPSGIHICTAIHFVTEEDILAGQVVNEALVTGCFGNPAQGGVCVEDRARAIVPAPEPDRDITLDKFAEGQPLDPSDVEVGDQITYVFVVTNTGNVTLFDIDVTDPMLEALDIVVDCGPGQLGNRILTLVPGEAVECTAVYTVQPGDLDGDGFIDNTATAECETDDSGGNVCSDTDSERVPGLPSDPDFEVNKSADADAQTGIEEGEVITYTIRVLNTGDVTLVNFIVTDSIIDETDIDCGDGTNVIAALEPMEFVDCFADYTVTDSDIGNGEIVNDATVTGCFRQECITRQDRVTVPGVEPTPTPTPSVTATPTPTASPSPTPSPTASPTPIASPTPTATPTATATATATATGTATSTATATSTPTATAIATGTSTAPPGGDGGGTPGGGGTGGGTATPGSSLTPRPPMTGGGPGSALDLQGAEWILPVSVLAIIALSAGAWALGWRDERD